MSIMFGTRPTTEEMMNDQLTSLEPEDAVSKEPLKRSRDELEAQLLTAIQGLLGNGVTRRALNAPGSMMFEDICLNIHLYERLLDAAYAVQALKGYENEHRGYLLVTEA